MMREVSDKPLLIGEVYVDYTLPKIGGDQKVRLGGLVHAARGLWAADIAYAVAAICPAYLRTETENYLKSHGCTEVIWLGAVFDAPNVMIIGDPTETSDQGYDDLMRQVKRIVFEDVDSTLDKFRQVVIFPGKFELGYLAKVLHLDATVFLDIAYDVGSLAELNCFVGRIHGLFISTSSGLFLNNWSSDITGLIEGSRSLGASHLILKENRGGSRLFDLKNSKVIELPASLSSTVNSVGVGDAYTAVASALVPTLGWHEAIVRGVQVATAYTQTTFPDDLKLDVTRQFNLDDETFMNLGGCRLPWHERPKYKIYMAGPDFTYINKPEFDSALDSLNYHNFNVRRPVKENGELKRDAALSELLSVYSSDYQLLVECDLLFAVPLERDPGTLVEVGLAIAMGIPVITFDPRHENQNTMVIGGSAAYSDSLDECINAVFSQISNMRAETS